jgi:hypothetical protein
MAIPVCTFTISLAVPLSPTATDTAGNLFKQPLCVLVRRQMVSDKPAISPISEFIPVHNK